MYRIWLIICIFLFAFEVSNTLKYIIDINPTKLPYNTTLRQCEPVTEVDSRDVQDEIAKVMRSNTVTSVWLPITKVKFGSLRWMDGKDHTLKHVPEHKPEGQNCGKLSPQTGAIEEHHCYGELPGFICQVQGHNFGRKKNCFEYLNTSYSVTLRPSTWYQSVEDCQLQGLSLAVITDEVLLAVTRHIANMTDKHWLWVGLRSEEYRIEGMRPITHYFWGPWPVCPCPDTSCVIMKRFPDGQYNWSPADCQEMHQHLCKSNKTIVPGLIPGYEVTTATDNSTTAGGVLVVLPPSAGFPIIPVIIGLILAVLLVLVIVGLIYHCRKKPRFKANLIVNYVDDETGPLTEETTPLDQTDLKSTDNNMIEALMAEQVPLLGQTPATDEAVLIENYVTQSASVTQVQKSEGRKIKSILKKSGNRSVDGKRAAEHIVTDTSETLKPLSVPIQLNTENAVFQYIKPVKVDYIISRKKLPKGDYLHPKAFKQEKTKAKEDHQKLSENIVCVEHFPKLNSINGALVYVKDGDRVYGDCIIPETGEKSYTTTITLSGKANINSDGEIYTTCLHIPQC